MAASPVVAPTLRRFPMSASELAAVGASAPTGPAPHPPGPRFRCIYRSGACEINLDWPVDRIAEALADPDGTLWVDIQDGSERDLGRIESLFREVFGFHPLAIEDALREANVPKVDDWDKYLYLVFHAINFDPETDAVCLHELDVFLGRNYLVTYHAGPMKIVEQVRTLVERDSENRLRRRPDHVLYLLLDRGVADHLAAIEHLDDTIDTLMDEVLAGPGRDTLPRIFQVKQAITRVYRVIVPQREVANRLARDPYPQIGDRDRVYFRDVYDGLVRLHDLADSIRDLVTGAVETYLSVSANRTNDIMKTLTIVTVLFLPLNFIVGFFGMNFFGENIHIDELVSTHTLLFALGGAAMLGGALGLWFWGRRRGWY
jgi:magnesium transporter